MRMQTGVAVELQIDPAGAAATPKHLRVGVNTALVDHAALVGLLVRAGVITEEAYYEAAADGMEAEAKGYEDALRRKTGSNQLILGEAGLGARPT